MESQDLYSRLNDGILEDRFRRIRRNIERNLPLIKKHGGIAPVMNLLSGRHVVVVGAGPSLMSAMASLRKASLSSSVAVVAVDLALKPLVRSGVTVSCAVTCEAAAVDFFTGIDTGSMTLCAYAGSAPGTVSSWEGPVYFYNWMMNDSRFQGLAECAGPLGSVATGGTVMTQGVALAAGCSPASLALLGNDLGFRDLYYTRGNAHHDRMAERSVRTTTLEGQDKGMIRARSQYTVKRGDDVFFTDHQFLAAKSWLETLLPKLAVPVADCSYPGCSGTAVTRMDFKHYLQAASIMPRGGGDDLAA